MKRAALLAALLPVALLIGACGGGGSNSATAHSGRHETIWIDSSLPRTGPLAGAAQAAADGISLALKQARGRAGRLTVNWHSFDEGTGAAGFDPGAVAAGARHAANNPGTVYYIGGFAPGSSRISLPILNTAGIAQLSPTETAVGLTDGRVGAQPGEPGIYYPRNVRTFFRLLPSDAVQAAASLLTLRLDGCTHIALLYDGTGTSLAQLIKSAATSYQVSISTEIAVTAATAPVLGALDGFRLAHVECVELAGTASPVTSLATRVVHETAPNVHLILGSDGMCSRAWTQALGAAVAFTIEHDHLLMCTQPTLPVDAYPEGRQFATTYERVYGTVPTIDALLGYTAMKIGLDTIASLGDSGTSRASVRARLFGLAHPTPMGTISFDANGDSDLDAYGLYLIAPDGEPVYAKAVYALPVP